MGLIVYGNKLHIQTDVFKDVDGGVIPFGLQKFFLLTRAINANLDITLFNTYDFSIGAYSVHCGGKEKLTHDNRSDAYVGNLRRKLEGNGVLDGLMVYYNGTGEIIAARKVSHYTDNAHNAKLNLNYFELCEIAKSSGLEVVKPKKTGPMKEMIYEIVDQLTSSTWLDTKILVDDTITQVSKRFVPYMLMYKFGPNLCKTFAEWKTRRVDASEKMFWLRLMYVDPKMFDLVDKNKYDLPVALYMMDDYLSFVDSLQRKD